MHSAHTWCREGSACRTHIRAMISNTRVSLSVPWWCTHWGQFPCDCTKLTSVWLCIKIASSMELTLDAIWWDASQRTWRCYPINIVMLIGWGIIWIMFSHPRWPWWEKSGQGIAQLNDSILTLSLQGGPGSSGAKGESGDPGPQVKNNLCHLFHFWFVIIVK